MSVVIRETTGDDVEHILWALYTALDWNPHRGLPPMEVTLEHPEAIRYHRGWGRPGDLGIIAERKGRAVGVAFCRVFTETDHGRGYVEAREMLGG